MNTPHWAPHSRDDRPTYLEQIFNFEDPAFRQYISAHKQNDIPHDELITLSREMSTNPHPLVKYAGGWASFEAATYNNGPGNMFIRRFANLQKAQDLWAAAEASFHTGRDQLPTENLRGQYLGFELRAHLARTYVPIMDVAIRRLVGKEVPHEYFADALHKSQRKVTQFGEMLTDATLRPDTERNQVNRGVCREIITGALLQVDDPDVLVMSGSVRDDHNFAIVERGDLQVFKFTGDRVQRLLVQVTGDEDKQLDDDVMTVRNQEDLQLTGGVSEFETLHALARKAWDKPEKAPIRERLQELSSRLTSRLTRISHSSLDMTE